MNDKWALSASDLVSYTVANQMALSALDICATCARSRLVKNLGFGGPNVAGCGNLVQCILFQGCGF